MIDVRTTETVGVAQATSNIVPDSPIVVDVYRLKSDKHESSAINDYEIRGALGAAATVLARDTDDHYQMKIGDIADIYKKPSGFDLDSGEACYTTNDIRDVASGPHSGNAANQLTHIVANQIDVCRGDVQQSDRLNHGVAAFASGDMSFYGLRYGEGRSTFYDPHTILHEVGHNIGLEHFPVYTCQTEVPDGYTDSSENPVLNDIKDVVNDPSCGLRLDEHGNVEQYADPETVMGGAKLDQRDISNPVVPAFSNLDRITLMSDVYRVKTIGSQPASYELGYGEGLTNAVEIKLGRNHPLKQIDQEITKLIAVTELDTRYMRLYAGAANKIDRDCATNTPCSIRLVATNDDYSLRYALPPTIGSIPSDNRDQEPRKVAYIDQSKGIGIVTSYQVPNGLPKLEVVSYETAVKLASLQQEDYEELLASINPVSSKIYAPQ